MFFMSTLAALILAFFFTLPRTGKSNPARIPMIAMTTSNSMSVNARRPRGPRKQACGSGPRAGFMERLQERDPGCTVSGWAQSSSVHATGRLSSDGSLLFSVFISVLPVADDFGFGHSIGRTELDFHPEIEGLGIVSIGGVAEAVVPGIWPLTILVVNRHNERAGVASNCGELIGFKVLQHRVHPIRVGINIPCVPGIDDAVHA